MTKTSASINEATTLAARVAAELGREHSARVLAYHQAIADRLGLHPTDLKTIDLVSNGEGQVTPGAIREATGLSSGAVTFVIDRLEKAGILERARDPRDRRRWTLTTTAEAAERVAKLYAPLARRMQELTADFTDDELNTILRFIAAADDVLSDETTAVRNTES